MYTARDVGLQALHVRAGASSIAQFTSLDVAEARDLGRAVGGVARGEDGVVDIGRHCPASLKGTGTAFEKLVPRIPSTENRLV